MINTIKALCHPFQTIADIVNAPSSIAASLLRRNLFEQKANYLSEKALHSVEKGVSTNKLCDSEVIVSLTSYDRRVNDVYLAIESIMQGSILPNRIILWLSECEFKSKVLPITLQNQQKRGLDIRFCKDIKSYKKLVYTLNEFPNACVITIDDDLIYNFDLVENLIASHTSNPKCIWANRIHEIRFDNNKKIKSYLQWKMRSKSDAKNKKDNFFTSGGGTLFPPHSLHDEVFNENTFMDICPTADDIWFNAMARLKGTEICKSFTHSPVGDDFLINESLQSESLETINNNPINCQNDIQLKAVFEKYGIMQYK